MATGNNSISSTKAVGSNRTATVVCRNVAYCNPQAFVRVNALYKVR